MEPQFTVAICGGGNLAHGSIAAIGHFNPHYKINLLSRRPKVWSDSITGFTKGSAWESKGDLVGRINKVSEKASDVVVDADIIIVCSPGHTKIDILKQIVPYVKDGALVGTIFGQGGFDLQARYVFGDLIAKKELTIFSFQYVPFTCKAITYGQDINIIGPKKTLYAAAYPIEKLHYACNAISLCYCLPCVPVPSFLNLTLGPSNQIIHPGRLLGFFSRFPEQAAKVLKQQDVPLLYEGIDDLSALEIQGLDNEIQDIKRAITKKYPKINLDQVIPLKERLCSMYKGQISDTSSLKSIFNTNKGYSKLQFPMLPVPDQDLKNILVGNVKVRLNYNSRFFVEDLPFGLVILKDIGNIMGVPTPNITRAIVFQQQYMPIKYVDPVTGIFNQLELAKTGAPSAYGITTADELVNTSMPENSSFFKNNIFFKDIKK